jgi:hypothetical protein
MYIGRHATGIKHFNVESTSANTYFLKDHFFPTMDELVKYYGERDVPNKEQIPNVRLKKPILRFEMQQQHSLGNVYEDRVELRPQQEQLARSSRDSLPSDIYLHMVILFSRVTFH